MSRRISRWTSRFSRQSMMARCRCKIASMLRATSVSRSSNSARYAGISSATPWGSTGVLRVARRLAGKEPVDGERHRRQAVFGGDRLLLRDLGPERGQALAALGGVDQLGAQLADDAIEGLGEPFVEGGGSPRPAP